MCMSVNASKLTTKKEAFLLCWNYHGKNSLSKRCDNERGGHHSNRRREKDPYHCPYQLRLPWVCCFKQIPALPISVTTLPLLQSCSPVCAMKSISSDRERQSGRDALMTGGLCLFQSRSEFSWMKPKITWTVMFVSIVFVLITTILM